MFSLEVSEYQDTDARGKRMMFSLEYSSTNAIFSIEMKMEEIELVGAQKNKEKKSGEIKINSFYGISGLSRIRCMDGNRGCLIELSSINGKCPFEALVGRSNTVVTKTYEFDYRNKLIILNVA